MQDLYSFQKLKELRDELNYTISLLRSKRRYYCSDNLEFWSTIDNRMNKVSGELDELIKSKEG